MEQWRCRIAGSLLLPSRSSSVAGCYQAKARRAKVLATSPPGQQCTSGSCRCMSELFLKLLATIVTYNISPAARGAASIFASDFEPNTAITHPADLARRDAG